MACGFSEQSVDGSFALRLSTFVALSTSLLLFGQIQAFADQRESWKVSCYAYRDVNRNGIFDMGDRPYAALPIQMTRPDGSKTTINSNIDGFANFVVRYGDTKNANVFAPGDHEVRSYPPPGWKLTSDNDSQILSMERIDDAPGGMFVAETCVPIGVAPILNIKGGFSAPQGAELGAYNLSISDEQGQVYSIPFDVAGNFEFVGYPGVWTLSFADVEGVTQHSQAVRLSDAAVVLSHIDLQHRRTSQTEGGEIITLDFDDLTISDALFEIPSGYGGLNWRNWISVHNRFYQGAGYVNATVSSEYVAYNSSGTPGVIWSDEPFDFIGVYIGAAWPRGEEKDVVVKAWAGDELIHEDRLRIFRAGPVYFSANYTGITKLDIAIDNLSVRK
jgi:hypothetical protein